MIKEIDEDVDIEELAEQTKKNDLKDMVTDILNHNNSRISSGKKKGDKSIQSQPLKPKPKRSQAAILKRMREKSEKLIRILQNDDEQLEKFRLAGLKKAKKLEKKTVSQKSDSISMTQDAEGKVSIFGYQKMT